MQERFDELSTTTQDKQEKTKHAKTAAAYARNFDKTRQDNNKLNGGYNLHAPSSFFSPSNRLHSPLSIRSEMHLQKSSKAPTSKAKETQTKLLLVPAAMRHASLGLVAFQREIVERARGRAHARSGGFGLDLRRLFCHDGHFLVDDHAAGFGGDFGWWWDFGGLRWCGSGGGCGSGRRGAVGFDVLAGGGLGGLGCGLRGEGSWGGLAILSYVQTNKHGNCVPVVSILSAAAGAVSVLGTGSGLSSSADMAETGRDTVRSSLEIGVGPTGETGALSLVLLSSADLWYCALTAFAMLELPASGAAAPAPAPAPARGTAVCLSECWPVARGWVGGSFGGTSGLLSCCCWW